MLFPLKIPPGIFRDGTEYASKGRWYDSNLIRWYSGGTLGPVGGWAKFSTSTMTGVPRAGVTWRDNSGVRWGAFGTESHLYAMNSGGGMFDITPLGFTPGRADGSANTGYGAGLYGVSSYGTARVDSGAYLEATVQDLDTFGQYLVSCSPDDGSIYEWQLSTGTPAAVIAGAPVSNAGIVVTKQGFLVALGAGGNFRLLQWCDQGLETSWTPTAANQAGSIPLYDTNGRIRCGRGVGEETLILTDTDAHVMNYIGLPYVYAVRKVGEGCGATSKRCAVSTGQFVVWWSNGGFWIYDGSARPLNCDVWDYLQRNLSLAQRSKISGWHNAAFGEIWWEWPPQSGTENSAYVFWDYRDNIWGMSTNARVRTCGVEMGVFSYPFLCSTDGNAYQHEIGFAYAGDTQGVFGRSGAIELPDSEYVLEAMQMIQDELTTGDTQVSFRTRPYPNGPESIISSVSFDGTGKADLRFSDRQIEMVVNGVQLDSWRFGEPRLKLMRAGTR